jgi:hypothetical protein
MKSQILGQAVDNRWLLVFGHCPHVTAAYLAQDEKRNAVVQEAIDLS